MCKTRLTALIVAMALALGFTPAVRATVGVRVIIENRAPDNGTWLTPIWVGFHDGSFDTYDMNLPASEAVERLAEDGNADPLSAAFAASGTGTIDGVIPADMGIPPIGPGETATMTFVLNNYDSRNSHFSYVSMVIPSNDAFIGNEDPGAHRVFDAYGNFLGGFFTIYGSDVLDAGTELNDEIPEHTAFFGQTVPDSGVDEFGVVHAHPGYLPPGSGGILDDPNFANADFTAPGYEIARIILVRSDTVVPSGAVSGTWDLDGSPYLLQGDVVVPYGETLIIEPGVQVVSLCDCRLVVEGSLQAIGTEEAPIIFTKDGSISEWHGLHFFWGSEPSRLSHCTVEYGAADNTAPDSYGGGIYCEQSALDLDHCTIRYNDAWDGGGGIYAFGSDLTVSHCQLEDNTAEDGAGAMCEFSNVVFHASEIAYNYAYGAVGGGLYLRYCDTLLLQNDVSDNQVYVYDPYGSYSLHAWGGGLAFSGNSPTLLFGNRITDNLAQEQGPYGSSAYGGGIWSDGGPQLTLINNTIANNVASASPDEYEHGGGLYVYSSDVSIINTIMWNDAPQEISSPSEYGTTDISVGYSDVQGGEGAVEIHPNHPLYWLAGNIDTNPLFVAPGAGDYSLLEDSPCIDAGDPNSYPDPDGTVADMGAFYFDQGIVGDLNGDGQVDLSDLAQLLAHYGTPSGALPEDGDLDGDGDVDLSDLAALLGHYGAAGALSGACCVMGQCVELTEDACAQVGGVFHGEGTTCADTGCDFWEYENITDFAFNWPKPGANVGIADDIELVGSGSRRLYYYSLRVYASEGEPYDCTAELWTDCPGNSGEPIAGTSRTWTDLPVQHSSTLEAYVDNIEIPSNVWMVVTFSTDYAGWIVADEAETGYTSDFYGLDMSPWSCTEVIPDDEYFTYYSGFWATVRCH
jgi:hypothetical protein